MSSIQIARDILWGDVLKAVLLEPRNGLYEVVKALPGEESLSAAPDVLSYCQMMADEMLIHPDDLGRYLIALRKFNKAGLTEALDGKRYSRKLRYRVGGRYIWTSFEIVYPLDYSNGERPCVFCLRRADSKSMTESDSDMVEMSNVMTSYLKVLKVDLSNDTYQVLKLPDSPDEVPSSTTLSHWLAAFSAEHKIHSDDLETYETFTDLSRIRASFEESPTPQHFKYRRDMDGEYRWVKMELTPSVEYSPERPIIMLFIRSVHEEQKAPAEPSRPKPDDDIDRDKLTGLKNYMAMQSDITDIENMPASVGIGVLYASVNGLARVIAIGGKAAGDAVISEAADMLTATFRQETCYCVSKDEFVAIVPDVGSSTFTSWSRNMRVKAKMATPPHASIGFVWEKHPESVMDLVRSAEKRMLDDKNDILAKYPALASTADLLGKKED